MLKWVKLQEDQPLRTIFQGLDSTTIMTDLGEEFRLEKKREMESTQEQTYLVQDSIILLKIKEREFHLVFDTH